MTRMLYLCALAVSMSVLIGRLACGAEPAAELFGRSPRDWNASVNALK
jgi:hypothetical protein